jgi:hypothetical protein
MRSKALILLIIAMTAVAFALTQRGTYDYCSTDVFVVDTCQIWLRYKDSEGRGLVAVHAVSCPAAGYLMHEYKGIGLHPVCIDSEAAQYILTTMCPEKVFIHEGFNTTWLYADNHILDRQDVFSYDFLAPLVRRSSCGTLLLVGKEGGPW